jgi:hypothetical protein
MSMSKTKIAVLGVAGLTAATYSLWRGRDDVKGRFLDWKKERLRNAFYRSITEKDIAWG